MTATQSGAVSIQNLFVDASPPPTGERFDTLLEHKNLVIERISSSSCIEPKQYVQPQDEWVQLVQGTAVIEIDGKTQPLQAGDYFFLPARTPHSVKSVSDGAMWLAVHLHP